ncbi:MAG TPA: GNAT family protein [Propionibacteriaceae bacterium]|nr:GNAT family protein [Propionibacteriaceae bacterium]
MSSLTRRHAAEPDRTGEDRQRDHPERTAPGPPTGYWGSGRAAVSQRSPYAPVNPSQSSASHVPRTRFALAIVRRDLNELIGSVELQITSREDGCGVLGYVLGRRSWGQGYATEAAAGMLRYGFDELRLRSISATCDPDNAASAAVLKKIGMHQVGHLHHHVYTRGEWRDRLQFACPSR